MTKKVSLKQMKTKYPLWKLSQIDLPLDDKLVEIRFWLSPTTRISSVKCTLVPREMTKRELLSRLLFRIFHNL